MEKVIIKDIKEIVIYKEGMIIYQKNEGVIKLNKKQILDICNNNK